MRRHISYQISSAISDLIFKTFGIEIDPFVLLIGFVIVVLLILYFLLRESN